MEEFQQINAEGIRITNQHFALLNEIINLGSKDPKSLILSLVKLEFNIKRRAEQNS